MLANPAKDEVAGLGEFRPIPSLLRLDPETLGYFGADGKPLGAGEKVGDVFLP